MGAQSASSPERCRLAEFEARFGAGYLRRIPGRYWIAWGGRALVTFGRFLPKRSARELVLAHAGGCRKLANTDHFHVDLYGNYVPGLCPGLAIDHRDLLAPVDPERYPVVTTLYERGVGGLLEMGLAQGFVAAKPGYANECHLCDAIRRHLARRSASGFPDLRPRDFYPLGVDGGQG